MQLSSKINNCYKLKIFQIFLKIKEFHMKCIPLLFESYVLYYMLIFKRILFCIGTNDTWSKIANQR